MYSYTINICPLQHLSVVLSRQSLFFRAFCTVSIDAAVCDIFTGGANNLF